MKTAIITGSNKGIGRAIALRLAQDGLHVVLCARDQAQLDGAVAEIRAAGGQASAIALDLREPESPGKLAEFAVAQTGRIDVVVSNAGATKRGEFDELADADFLDGFALKYFGAVRLTRAAWQQLKANKGSIVYISGIGGHTPGRQFTIGGSVNAALLSFTKAMAETGLRDGVQVNAINPGPVRTARFQHRLDAEARSAGGDAASIEKQFVKDHRVTRIGEPIDIAHLVAFVVSAQGSLLHGSIIDMDGGSTKSL